jgi:flagellar FliL protein
MIMGGVAAAVVLGGGGRGRDDVPGRRGQGGRRGRPRAQEEGSQEEGRQGGRGAAYGEVRDGPDGVVFYTLPDLVANIRTTDGKPAYLKLKLTLELPDHATADAFEPNAPRLSDMFTTFLRELREEDLTGSAGSYQLRMELQRRVNLVIAPAKVNSVLIEEMLVQ